MNDAIIATLNGRPLLDLHVELKRGGRPSTLRATLPPGEKISGDLELEVADAETSRVFRQFRVTRQTFLALHPEVVLAFGHPDFNAGRVHSGWALHMAEAGGHLEIQPRDIDASIPAGADLGVHVTGHMQVGPDGAGFGDTQALRLGASDDEGIAFGDDVELYRDGAASLRTDGAFGVGGKLTVEGLIDPTGLELAPQSSNPGATGANTIWMKSSDSRLYHGPGKLALASELPSLPLSIANGGTGATSGDGAINELINDATLDTTLSPSDEILIRSSLVGRKTELQYLLASVAGLSQLGSVGEGDKLLVIDTSGAARFVKFEDLAPTGANLTASVIAYAGSGSSGHTVSLTGINRAYAIVIARTDTYTNQWVLSIPAGTTGAQATHFTSGYASTVLSLNAPSSGSDQTLTLNTTSSDLNGSSGSYRALVLGTPT